MITFTLLVFSLSATAKPVFDCEPIFTPNDKHNHGSSLVQTPNGDLLACWFHGSGERTADDVLIQGARKKKGRDHWSDVFVMADSQDLPDCNPVLFVDPRGELWLFWITVQNNQWGGSLLKYRTASKYSKAGPPQWSWQDVIHCRPQHLEELFLPQVEEAEKELKPLLDADPKFKKEVEDAKVAAKDKLSQRLGWMTRLHPIMLSDHRMMLGLYSDVFNGSLAAFTNDWGKTWEFGEPILGLGNIQPSFVKKQDGTLVAYMRDNGIPHKIRIADSSDGGMKWSPVRTTSIPNPGSSVECAPLKNGHWVLVCNDTTDGRHILTAYLSDDEGASWKWKRRIEAREKNKASASYPSVIQDKKGFIHCTYSFTEEGVKGSTIRHARFNEEWIKEGEKE